MGNSLTGVVISDLHEGSYLSPIPDGFKTKQGTIIKPNKVQRDLNKAFDYVADVWQKPDVLIVLGDATDGKGRKSYGTEQWSTSFEDQYKAAAQLLRKFKAKEYYVIFGTDYHVNNNGEPVEEDLAKQLGAEKIGSEDQSSGLKFMIEAGDIRLHFAHHVPTSQTEWFLGTPGAKEGIRLQLQWRKLGHVDALFRGHNHYWWHQDGVSQHIVQCPAWQLPTSFMHRRSGEPLTNIGAVRFRITEKPDDFGEHLRVTKQVFTIESAKTRVVKKW